ncbi:MAG: PorV/PorQ family protein [candidate division KSB1 bacterium]|nr:PorV/PorQ family protein [candidate division KSB1 bacterium]MDZ7392989.1 PorV/PorQ family protein [candidate division KSB1 bacterium]MDZ7413501.1 PorV/PorQ family protein [candidate division KSB1 bacterium]
MRSKNGRRLKTLLSLFLALPLAAWAQYERPGSTDAQFLKIGVSARGAGMGDAFIAVVEGAEAAYYNPAALAWIPSNAVAFTHTGWFAGINHDFVAAAHTFGRNGTFALSATALYTDEMMVRTPLQPDGTGETFYAGNYRVGLSYARYLTDRVTFGGSLNYVRMSLYSDFVGEAVAADIGVLYVTHFRGFRFGMKIANFGSEVKFVHESYPLPTNFTFGLAMNAIDGPTQTLAVSFSAVKPNDGRPLGDLGAEWSYQRLLFLRGGYHLNHDVARYAFGGGLQLDLAGVRLRLDYAYSDFSLLGAAQRIGINAQF